MTGAGMKPDENAGAAPFVGPGGEALFRKPEHLTHLRSNRLVRKDHPVIAWRGALDVFSAALAEAALLGERLGDGAFVLEIREILDFVERLAVCEAKETALGEFTLMGLPENEVRRLSHAAAGRLGTSGPRLFRKMKEQAACLNRLRALCRQAESAAVAAFMDESPQAPRRPDIVLALNRLSSLLHVLTVRRLSSESVRIV
ncbi:MAG: hypothetical protein LBE84_11485 [Planctomycetota bacterium]|jgi:ethanolamine utilization cobalamin adenosyltransferase|nr:hypothetical protein [Planctomycetota bacterium]